MNTGLVFVVLLAPALAVLTLAVLRRGPGALGSIQVRGKGWILTAAAVQYLRSTRPDWAQAVLRPGDAVLLLALCACGVGFAIANGRWSAIANGRWSAIANGRWSATASVPPDPAVAGGSASRRTGHVRWSLLAFCSGMLLNALATVVNGGMPFSVPSARAAGIGEAAIAAPSPGHLPMDGATRLAPLADVVPLPVLHIVFSVGDVLLWLGLAGYLVALARAATDLPGRSAGVSTTSGAAQPTY